MAVAGAVKYCERISIVVGHDSFVRAAMDNDQSPSAYGIAGFSA
jgi:hypothetical protein